MNAERLAILISCSLADPCRAQQSLESEFRTTGPAVTAVFEPQRAVLQTSSAVILDGRKEIGYGVVVSADGHILTKASEIEGVEKLSVTVDRTNYKEVNIARHRSGVGCALLEDRRRGLGPGRVRAHQRRAARFVGGGQRRDLAPHAVRWRASSARKSARFPPPVASRSGGGRRQGEQGLVI